VRVLLVLALAACGRFDFDLSSDSGTILTDMRFAVVCR
jgi:hypothetical protein